MHSSVVDIPTIVRLPILYTPLTMPCIEFGVPSAKHGASAKGMIVQFSRTPVRSLEMGGVEDMTTPCPMAVGIETRLVHECEQMCYCFMSLVRQHIYPRHFPFLRTEDDNR
ncbi:hypothetical protein Agabi119p4_11420 [Agaricus bisporus var. burnettii]|uniref:Uncharacterized protein n=1 Tax=Agaricus bisporus var. burnettii TaxID=192524 RepID=A0A8H7C061_AGABI|nr:hypothetical protein Agabi119p4_11420 [Agaricus bisporus var. burnettii]